MKKIPLPQYLKQHQNTLFVVFAVLLPVVFWLATGDLSILVVLPLLSVLGEWAYKKGWGRDRWEPDKGGISVEDKNV
jgi:hypothetical protein